MTPEDRKIMREEIISAVRETVNGRFDPLSPTFALKAIHESIEISNKHMKEMQPILNAYRGSKILGHLLKWLASVAIAWLVLNGIYHGIIHF